ncbi:50S ribosomal protein L11 methyltransferase [Aerococcaceae bacterium WGS1372]
MSEKWTKVSITINSLQADVIDLVNYYLSEMGAIGTEINYAQGYLENHPNLFGEIPEELPDDYLNHPVVVVGYFESAVDLVNLEQSLGLIEDLVYEVEINEIINENWHQNWMKYYKVERLSRFLTIVPEWDNDYQKLDNEVIYMDPGVAFGTGNHPTTRLSAQALEFTMKGNETILDVGTGTGILSFIAGVFGAKEVLGMDLDPQAVSAANHNLQSQRNNPKLKIMIDENRINFIENNLLNNINQKADIIVANILPHILIDMFDDAYKLLEDDGYLILGGILKDKAKFIENSLLEHRFTIYSKTESQGWVSYIAIKGE